MEILGDLIKILLPAVVVLYAVYLTVRAFLVKEYEQKLLEVKRKNAEVVLPVRLQAYERMCLFLERITPSNLILRVSSGMVSAREFQHVLLSEIREEYNHNLSQQVYMSDEAWEHIRSAVEETIAAVNQAADDMSDDARSIDLAKRIFEIIMHQEVEPTNRALRFVKNEIRQIF